MKMKPLSIYPNTNPLDQIQIATPCDARWEDMLGDNRVRFCGSCTKHVYNLSEMQTEEALALIQDMEGDLCVRLYRRADGTVLTQDCPVGLAAKARQKARRFYAGAIAMGLSLMAGISGALGKSECTAPITKTPSTEAKAMQIQAAEPVRALPNDEVIMGEMVLPKHEVIMGGMKSPQMGAVAPRAPIQ